MNKQQMCRARISTLISLALTREFLILKLYIENHICHTQWWYHPPPPQKKNKNILGGGGACYAYVIYTAMCQSAS